MVVRVGGPSKLGIPQIDGLTGSEARLPCLRYRLRALSDCWYCLQAKEDLEFVTRGSGLRLPG